MLIDQELYRQEVRVSVQPLVRLSVIDIAPDYAKRPILFVHGFGGYAGQWQYQLREFSAENRVIACDLRGHGRSDKLVQISHEPDIKCNRSYPILVW
jgi:pimeloyl-ACP methyl ester carboxylesterase